MGVEESEITCKYNARQDEYRNFRWVDAPFSSRYFTHLARLFLQFLFCSFFYPRWQKRYIRNAKALDETPQVAEKDDPRLEYEVPGR